jgi:predicted GIY-YIG superfamily endonuclease
VYVLKSLSFEQLYDGSTNDLRRRFAEHNNGKEFHTRKYLPWQLKYYEAYDTEKLARAREQKLKQHGNAIRELKKRI